MYGFSVPKMLGTDHDPVILGDIVIPTAAHGVRCLSMGFFVPDDQPVIWRGPMLHKAIQQFLTDAYWGEPDFVLVDMPPGTGDVAFDPRRGDAPGRDRRCDDAAAGGAAGGTALRLRGAPPQAVCARGDREHELVHRRRREALRALRRRGGAALASDLGVPLLGQVPLVNAVRLGGDEGRPITAVDPDSETAQAFRMLAQKLAGLGPARVYRRAAELALEPREGAAAASDPAPRGRRPRFLAVRLAPGRLSEMLRHSLGASAGRTLQIPTHDGRERPQCAAQGDTHGLGQHRLRRIVHIWRDGPILHE